MLASSIFRNYDVRGEYGKDLTGEAGYKVAKAFAKFSDAKQVVLGSDCRMSSPALRERVIHGLLESGVDVVDIGSVSTDVLYFATWFYKFEGGIMVTASHMPKQFNGLKFLRLNDKGMLAPIGKGLGMEDLEEIAQAESWKKTDKPGQLTNKDVWNDFTKFTRSFVDVQNIKPMKVVMDTGNGMGGPTAERVYVNLGLNIVPLYFQPDGNFPNHPANPIEEENRRDVVAAVKKEGADLGLAWDADCDRIYFIDENGNFVNGDFITALMAIYFLEKNPGAGIVYDIRASLAVKDWVEKMGGKAHMERVGHTYIKKRMQETQSVFGGEISGHYYFSSNAYMENGFAPALIIMEIMSVKNKKLSELVAELGDYYVSGEINFKVADVSAVLKKIESKYADAKEILRMDGLSFVFGNWRFNIRPSANDPVLRLNLEAVSESVMIEKVEEVGELIKE